MRGSWKNVVAIVIGLALAAPAFAGLSSEYAGWADGPIGFLLTKKERKQWKRITTDAEAKRFIELFWARRDPNLDTPYNEFKARTETLIRYADEHFGTEKQRGAMTDRGKVLILMGMPYSVEHRGPTHTMETIASNSAGTDQVWNNAELWLYLPDRLPAAFKIKGSRLVFVFYEEKPNSNMFTLDRTHREGTQGLRALVKAPEVWLVHPELKEPPKPVSVPGGSPATPAHLAWLDGQGALGESVEVLASLGVADAEHRPLWVHVELPKDAPVIDTIAGRVLSADGSVDSTFEVTPTALDTGWGTGYELAFPLLPGTYTVEFAGAAAGAVQFVEKRKITVPVVPNDEAWIAGPWYGTRTIKEANVVLGAPFQFGVIHLIPDVSGKVRKSDEFSYFGFASGLEGEHPSLDVEIQLGRDGKKVGRPIALSLPLVRIADNLWVYASTLNLGGLPKTGAWDLTFTMKAPGSEAARTAVVHIDLVE